MPAVFVVPGAEGRVIVLVDNTVFVVMFAQQSPFSRMRSTLARVSVSQSHHALNMIDSRSRAISVGSRPSKNDARFAGKRLVGRLIRMFPDGC